jgi:hypothetical protein
MSVSSEDPFYHPRIYDMPEPEPMRKPGRRGREEGA